MNDIEANELLNGDVELVFKQVTALTPRGNPLAPIPTDKIIIPKEHRAELAVFLLKSTMSEHDWEDFSYRIETKTKK